TPSNARALASTDTTFDQLGVNGWFLVANGYQRCNDATNPLCNPVLPALPANGIIGSTSDPVNLSWQLGPYHGINGVKSNNSIRMTGAMRYAIAVPNREIGDVYILGAAAGGTVSTTITLKFVS